MEIHRELGKGHDEVIYKDALVIELSRAEIPFSREKNYEITYKGVILPHYYYADFRVCVTHGRILRSTNGERSSDSNNGQANQNLPEVRRKDLLRRAGKALPQMCAEKCAWQFPGRGCSRGRLVRRSRLLRRSSCEGRIGEGG